MDDKARTATSKYLSYLLRHEPEAAGLSLDPAGWVEVNALLDACSSNGHPISLNELHELVATSPKQRFALSPDGLRIRANQGHSTPVDLGYAPCEPPDILFHGTVAKNLPSIRASGLQRMDRHHVHLSSDEQTAVSVAMRRGKSVVLIVDARAMRDAGHTFYQSTNGVWLTDAVPPNFIAGLGDNQT